MAKLSRGAAVLLSCVALGCALEGQQPKATEKVNPDAQTLQEFKARIDKYMELHNSLEKEGPPLEETAEPAKIQASQDALAAKLRAARKDARQGDIFTPAVARLFRRLMYPELKGADGAATKEAIKDDAPPAAAVPIKVHAKYPESAPLPTVPPNLLAALPDLPEDLEYRIVGRSLLLRDVHANIIVDFIPNAVR
jgi:hypothetical protein